MHYSLLLRIFFRIWSRPTYNLSVKAKFIKAGLLKVDWPQERFLNRLNIAYSDLLMQKRLVEERRQNPFSYKDIIDKYFDNWEDRFEDLLSTDPCSFPGFRQSIEAALNKEVPPCGIVAGVADFKASKNVKVGVLLSNVSFKQAP